MKTCPRCERILSHDDFHRNRARHDGLAHYCKDCNREYKRRYRATASRTAKRHYVKRVYGITLDALEGMLAAQTACDVCGDTPESYVVDHCHATGRFRGLLCTQCNVGLGMFKDNPQRLALAATYLKERSATSH